MKQFDFFVMIYVLPQRNDVEHVVQRPSRVAWCAYLRESQSTMTIKGLRTGVSDHFTWYLDETILGCGAESTDTCSVAFFFAHCSSGFATLFFVSL